MLIGERVLFRKHNATAGVRLTRSASNLANMPLVVVTESDLKRFLLNVTAALTDDIMRARRDSDMMTSVSKVLQ